MPRRAQPQRGERYSHNDARRVDRRSSYAIEESQTASRKATRSSSNRIKPDAALRLTATLKSASPSRRALRSRAKSKPGARP